MRRIEIVIPDDLYRKLILYRQLHREKKVFGKPPNIGELIKSEIEEKLLAEIAYLEGLKPRKIGRPRTKNHLKNVKHGTSDNSL